MKRANSIGQIWRHAYAWALIIFAIFPIYVVVLSSFDPTGGLASSTLLPQRFSWENYETLFSSPTIPFMTWMGNSVYLAALNAVLSIVVGAFSAYAFSRLRFKGRKAGLQALLLIQVFPAFLALAAIYAVAVGLQSFVGAQFGANWGPFAAGSILASMPLIALFLSLQKYIIGGLVSGSVKG